jgi:hypothetical protein
VTASRGLRPLLAGAAGAFCFVLAAPATAQDRPAPFEDWAVVVAAGDFRSSEGGSTEAFDNARRDVVQRLQQLGFRAANIRQLSTRPNRYRSPRPMRAGVPELDQALGEVAGTARGGCLVYATTHGSPDGVVMNKDLLTPQELAEMLERHCSERLSVVVLSACYSGVFVPALAAPDRMVLTAARRDRTSFGCGESDRYPYFDDCFLRESAGARDFNTLAPALRRCVAGKEVEEGMKPPSEPQVYIGAQARAALPLLRFSHGAPAQP